MSRTLYFLIVDDDRDDTALFTEVMEDIAPAVNTDVAGDGMAALEKLRSGDTLPDIIFLDLNMPRMGGKECLKEIKADAVLSDTPVIMYTTSSQSRDIEETMMSGAVAFITKPTSMKELKTILSTIVNSVPHGLREALRSLGNSSSTFIVSS